MGQNESTNINRSFSSKGKGNQQNSKGNATATVGLDSSYLPLSHKTPSTRPQPSPSGGPGQVFGNSSVSQLNLPKIPSHELYENMIPERTGEEIVKEKEEMLSHSSINYVAFQSKSNHSISDLPNEVAIDVRDVPNTIRNNISPSHQLYSKQSTMTSLEGNVVKEKGKQSPNFVFASSSKSNHSISDLPTPVAIDVKDVPNTIRSNTSPSRQLYPNKTTMTSFEGNIVKEKEKQSPSHIFASKSNHSISDLPTPVARDVKHVPTFANPINSNISPENPFLSVNSIGNVTNTTRLMRSTVPNNMSVPTISLISERKHMPNQSISEIMKEPNINDKEVKDSLFTKRDNSQTNFSSIYGSSLNGNNLPKQTFQAGISTKNKLTTDENSLLLSFKSRNSQYPTNSSEKSIDEIIHKEDKVNRKLLIRQNRKNISKPLGSKNCCTKSSTCAPLKHVEKIAESLSSFSHNSDTKTNAFKIVSPSKKQVSSQKCHLFENLTQGNCTLEDCIFQMTNLEIENEENVSLLQKVLLQNLMQINSFMSTLKLCPISNQDIFKEIGTLKDIVLSFLSEAHVSGSGDSQSAFTYLSNTTNFVKIISGNEVSSNISLKNSDKSSETKMVEGKNNTSNNQNVVSLNSFKAILNELPPELDTEKANIFLQNSMLYCKVCDKQISFNYYNLETHLKGKNHLKMLEKGGECLKKEQQNFTNLLNSKEVFEESISLPVCEKGVYEEYHTLPPNYEGVLNIVHESHKNKLVLDINLYICRLCDFVINDKGKAIDHLNDESHKKQPLGDFKWHVCTSCSMNIYGSNDHFKEHSLTIQHKDVMRLKSKNMQNKSSLEENLSNISSLPGEEDSSEGGRSMRVRQHKKVTPHETLLSIAQTSLKEKGVPVGLYCQICNKYSVYRQSTQKCCQSDKHNEMLSSFKDGQIYDTYFCPSCQIHLFGDEKVMTEHVGLQLHVEMANTIKLGESSDVDDTSESDSEELSSLSELSNEKGPHFDLMKAVLMKHLNKESSKRFYGFLCYICETYTLDLQQWNSHLASASHRNRINSSECAGKKMLHNCSLCNICMICDERIFFLHQRSLAHQVVHRRQVRLNPSAIENNEVRGSDGDSSEDDSESSEDGDAASDTQSTASSNQNTNKKEDNKQKKIIRNGVHLTGLPVNSDRKEVFDVLKKFGFIGSCVVKPDSRSADVVFKKLEDAEKLLEKKRVFIRKAPVNVMPLFERFTREGKNKRKKVRKYELGPIVLDILNSWEALEKLVSILQSEMVDESIHREQKSKLIEKDLIFALPGCKVHFFGSQISGLATKNSDFDIYIDFDGLSFFTDLPRVKQVEIIQNLLYKFKHPRSRFFVKEAVLDARVPIMRVTHKETNTPCDISCKSGLSYENTQLIKLLVSSDHRVRWMVIVIKWWMDSIGLHDRTMFTSYATTWLVLFFMMRVTDPLLCPVYQLQQECKPYSIACWDCRFNRNIQNCFKSINKVSRYDLLAQFFTFYGTFSYNSVVLCPLTATLIPRKQFDDLRLPQPYHPYVNKVVSLKQNEKLRTTTPICLQDPFDLSHNVTKGVSHKDLEKFKDLCLQSAKICENLKRK